MHQTIIGLEAEKQMEQAGEYPDIVIGCFGGGSNFAGITFPFMRHTLLEGRKTRFVAAEPASCPKLTRGVFQYDFGDLAGLTPMLPMCASSLGRACPAPKAAASSGRRSLQQPC